MPRRVVIVGSCVVDRMSHVDRFPKPGESRFSRNVGPLVGGKGFNQAVAAHTTGADVLFVGCVGQDADGDRFQEFLVAIGKATHGIMRSNNSGTGQATVWVDSEGQNMICIDPGANLDLDPEWVSAFLHDEPLVLTQFETPDECTEICAGERLILNPAPFRTHPELLLEKAWLVTPNETEAREIARRPASATPQDLAEAIRDLGPPNVIVTLGAAGCFALTPTTSRTFQTPQVKALDCTGAGDVFNGVLAGLVAQDHTLEETIPWASAAAALSTTRQGAAPSVPSWDEVEALVHATN